VLGRWDESSGRYWPLVAFPTARPYSGSIQKTPQTIAYANLRSIH